MSKNSVWHIAAAALVSVGVCVSLSEFMKVIQKMSEAQVIALLLVCTVIYMALYFSSESED